DTKPAMVSRTMYFPGGSATVNVPSAPVCTLRRTPAESVTVRLAAGISAPDSSVTWPRKTPVVCCPNEAAERISVARIEAKTVPFVTSQPSILNPRSLRQTLLRQTHVKRPCAAELAALSGRRRREQRLDAGNQRNRGHTARV